MAGQKLSELTAVNGPIVDADQFLIVRSGASRKILGSQLKIENLRAKPTSGTVYGTLGDLLAASGLSVAAFGATGNGATDDTAAIQACVDAAHLSDQIVLFPAGEYLLSDEITLPSTGWAPSLIGIGNVRITQSNSAAWCFSLVSNSGGYRLDYQNRIEGFYFASKNGIRSNDALTEVAFGGEGTGATTILGWTIQRCTFYGTYAVEVDENFNTQEPLDRAEMISYGVGLQLSKCFNFRVRDCYFAGLGCGVLMYGTDISTITDCRFQSNARHWWAEGINFYGSQCLFQHNDVLGAHRPYGVWLQGAYYQLITDNYFENAPSMGYIRTVEDYGTQIRGNRISSYTDPAVPWAHFSPGFDLQVTGNIWQWNSTEPPCIVDADYINGSVFGYALQFARFAGNSPSMPLPDFPGVVIGDRDPQRFDYQNFQFIQGDVPDDYPWEQDGDRWVLKQGATPWCIARQVIPIPKGVGQVRVRIDFFGKRDSDDGFFKVKARYDDGAFIDIDPTGGAYMGFTSTDEYTTSSVWVTLPDAGTAASVELRFEIDPQYSHIAGWRVTPQTDSAGLRFTPRADYPALGSIVSMPVRIVDSSGAGDAIDTETDPALMLSIKPTGGAEVRCVSNTTPSDTASVFFDMPVWGGAGFYTGYFGGNGGGGIGYSASDNVTYLAAGTHTLIGKWSADPRSNAGATFTSYVQVASGGNVQIGASAIAAPDGYSMLQVSGPAATLYERWGSGSPEGAVTAPVGAIYHRTDGGANTSLYVKESGAGNTGWVGK